MAGDGAEHTAAESFDVIALRLSLSEEDRAD
jgi:hypothetical protein